MIFLNIGLWFLLACFTYRLVAGLVKAGVLLSGKTDGEQAAGCLSMIVYPVFYGLSIATMIGALFAVN